MRLRRTLVFSGLLVLVWLVVLPLAGAGRDAWRHWRWTRQENRRQQEYERMRARNAVPPPDLPLRAGDRERYPRDTFSIRYAEHHGFAVDTRAKTVTKDMIGRPDTTVALELAPGQVDSLYDRCLADRLFETVIESRPRGAWMGARDHGGVLVIEAGGVRNELDWYRAGFGEPWSDEWKRLDRAVLRIRDMAMRHPAYRRLPRPTGIYID